jgi:antitoxin HicB
MKNLRSKNPHDGTSLDDFLREEGIFEEVKAAALKRGLAFKASTLLRKKRNPNAAIAKQMRIPSP